MFVQVITGQVSDAVALRRQVERWRTEVRPGAVGFLGSTGGVADDGRFVVLARFADDAAARANADRPEQGEWWRETEACIRGEATFRESSDVTTLLDGGSDAAGFVQVMEGTVSDREKAEALETPEMLAQLRTARPDLIGSLRVWFDDGSFVEAVYFTSEEAARQGEQSDDFAGPQADFEALYGDIAFTDLREPIFAGPS